MEKICFSKQRNKANFFFYFLKCCLKILAACSPFLAGLRVKNEGSLLKSVKEMFIFSFKGDTLEIKLEMGRKGF